jgi:hypothetical protein
MGQAVTFADQQFVNHGRTTLVLDQVTLYRPRGLRLLGSYAVPGRWAVGEVFGWPPRQPDLPPTWKNRQPVHGFRLAPGEEFDMALGTAAVTRPLAETRGTVIRYHDKVGRYVYTNHFGMLNHRDRTRVR